MTSSSKHHSADANLEELETVIAITPLPFRGGAVDRDSHRKNVAYLLERNFLDGGRRRVIATAGTSLIHHLAPETVLEVIDLSGRIIGQDAILIAGLMATPPASADSFMERCAQMGRPPDFFLLMPLAGLHNPHGIGAELPALTGKWADRYGARFLLYMLESSLTDCYGDLLDRCPEVVGVKVGSATEDVRVLASRLPPDKKLLWGMGDYRSTEAARRGALGHTSGITLICPGVCDGINNACREGDYEEAGRLEALVVELEEIRLLDGGAYSYSAVVECARLGGFSDIDLGEGGPFNAPPPPEIQARIADSVERLREYH